MEDYFHVGAFENLISRENWHRHECRVVQNTNRLLDLFDRHNVRSTMFVLGWVAERFPSLVTEMARRGHELAVHGYDHRRLADLGPDGFRKDLRRSKRIVEETAGIEVIGYRAPNYSLVVDTMWAPEILLEEGFLYDSSVFPVYRGRTGIPDAPRHPWVISHTNGQVLHEFPPSTVRILGVNLPFVGGAYLRHFPMLFVRWGMRSVIQKERRPVMVYIHPWEIDPEQPRQQVSTLTRIRHYRNLDKMEERLTTLFSDFKFTTIREVLDL